MKLRHNAHCLCCEYFVSPFMKFVLSKIASMNHDFKTRAVISEIDKVVIIFLAKCY